MPGNGSPPTHQSRPHYERAETPLPPLAGVAMETAGSTVTSLESLNWQLLTRLRYTPGTCRVVSAEIVQVLNSYELRIAHEVLLSAGPTGRQENTEQHTPSYNNRADAKESLANYAVGTVHPCWYDARDPARYSVLVRRGIDPTVQFIVLGVSVLMGWVGVRIVRGANATSKAVQD